MIKPLKDSELTPKSRELASNEVKKCKERSAIVGIKRGCYNFFSPENKAKVAKYALYTIRFYQERYPSIRKLLELPREQINAKILFFSFL